MKRILSLLLITTLLAGVLALAEERFQPLPQETTEEQRLNAMLPILDSLSRGMNPDGALFPVNYDAADADFIWNQLWLLAANWIAPTQETLTEEAVQVPGALLRACASASFGSMISLPPLPESDPARVSVAYDAAQDIYTFSGSAGAQAGETVIDRYAWNDGALRVHCVTEDGQGQAVSEMTATLRTVFAPLTEAAIFPYAVIDARAAAPDDFDGLTAVACEIRAESPMPARDLSSGSRGEDVRALQQRLNALGYPCGSADGIYGPATRRGVRYFQDALDWPQDGVATAALQARLYDNAAPGFEPYVTQRKGASGIRVEHLQARLRELGYLARPVDGRYGPDTLEAVKRFQKAAKLTVDGIAGPKTLRALEEKGAAKCPGFIDLKRGDTGVRVTEMQKQLKALGLLSGEASGSYDSATAKAVMAFLKARGLSGNGDSVSAAEIEQMFEKPKPTATAAPKPTATPEPTAAPEPTATPDPDSTPTPEPDPTPTPDPDPTPTPEPDPTSTPEPDPTSTPEPDPTPTPEPKQVISDEQLTAFAAALEEVTGETRTNEDSVRWLQQKLGVSGNGIYDEATRKAVSDWQQKNGQESTGIPSTEMLAAL